MRKYLTVLLLCAAAFAHAQSRADIVIGIPMPTGGTSDQQQYFRENFIMETTAAGYTVAGDSMQADYTLNLEIKRNMILYDDGTEEPAPPEEKQYLLALHLVRNNDRQEIVYFDFPFTELEEMYEFNLYLLYQAMANVPLTKLTTVLEDDHWRNKWLYIRGSLDYSLLSYQADESQTNWEYDVYDKNQNGSRTDWIPLTPENSQVTRASPAATIGLELQFLNWMSVEGYAKLLFGDTGGASFVPTLGIQIKFPLKPSKHFMLEPYAAVDFPLNSGGGIVSFSPIGVGGGFQFGVKGGDMGAFFIDANFMYNLGDIHIRESEFRDAHWNRWVLSFGIGYKIGFFNRNADVDKTPIVLPEPGTESVDFSAPPVENAGILPAE